MFIGLTIRFVSGQNLRNTYGQNILGTSLELASSSFPINVFKFSRNSVEISYRNSDNI